MTGMLRGTPAPAAPAAQLWRTARLSLRFMLDLIELARDGGELLDPLILAAVIDANVAHLNARPELQHAYATLDSPPPDELRRPVSVNAVAQSLNLSFETVRRRVAHLAGRGLLSVTPKGVFVPQALLSSFGYEVLTMARYERLRAFYLDLKALDALPPLPPAEACLPPEPPPVRICARAVSEYSLRVVEMLIRATGDPLSGLLLLALIRANTEHIPMEALVHRTALADHERRPVRSAELARQIRMPAETVRRHMVMLEKAGLCRRRPDGYVVSPETAGREKVLRLIEENAAGVHRALARLSRLGVLDLWDRQAATGAA